MQYQKKTGRFPSTEAGKIISYYVYLPETENRRGILQIAHGMAEYLERYEPFIEFLLEHGFIVCGEDHIAHGNSVSSPEELGHIPGKEGWRKMVKDMHTLTRRMQQLHPGLPYFVLGHSMGSFLLRAYLIQYGEETSGAIIMGTGNNPAAVCNAGIGLCSLIGAVKGSDYRSPFISKMMFGSYLKRIPEPASSNDWLSVNPENVKKYDADPLCGFPFSVSGNANVMRLLKFVCAASWPTQVPKKLPILVTSGEEDPVGHYGKDPAKVALLLEKAGCEDVTLKLYRGDRHEILNENDRETVYADILAWLEDKLPKEEA